MTPHNSAWLLFLVACVNNEKLEPEQVEILIENDGYGFDEATDCADNNGAIHPNAIFYGIDCTDSV